MIDSKKHGDNMTSNVAGVQEKTALSPAWYIVGLLTFANIMSYADRHLLTLVVDSIRTDFNISDTQVALLLGPAFTLFYCVLSFPFGQLADRVNRKNLCTFAIATWSVMTLLCGLSENFWQLFAARAGVGIGEAALAPAALSMLSDRFAPESRGRAIGVFSSATYLGFCIAMVLGGIILRMFSGLGTVHMPVFGSLAVWQSAFIVAGLPGLVIALLLYTLKEPPRSRHIGSATLAGTRKFMQWLAKDKSSFLYVYVCCAIFTFATFTLAPWLATFFIRVHGMDAASAGLWLGGTSTPAGLAGCVIAGAMGDRWTRQRSRGGKFRGIFFGLCIMLPSLVLMVSVRSTAAALAWQVLFTFGNAACFASSMATIQDMVPGQFRGQAAAILLLSNAIIGYALGPVATALVTEHVFKNDAALGQSFLVVTLPGIVIAMVLAYAGRNAYDRTCAKVRAAAVVAPETAPGGAHAQMATAEQ